MPEERAVERAAEAVARVRQVLAQTRVPGAVLTTPGGVAWASGGGNPPIDRTAATDVVWVAVGPEHVGVVTTEVEAPRLRAEGPIAALGWPVVAVPWWDSDAFVGAAAKMLDAAPSLLGGDGHRGFGHDLTHSLVTARMRLSAPDVAQMRRLGADAAAAVEGALAQWRPGETDHSVAARIAAAVETCGATAPVLLVGGDDRLRRFRHPVAVGRPMSDVVMAVLVAARAGLHVALTRYAGRAAALDELAEPLGRARRIHARTLAACRAGVEVGAVLDTLAAGYQSAGVPDGWRQHYQGGPIAYGQREFEIAPVQRDSEWWGLRLERDVAVAWNPSLPGGAKDEDTYLVGDGEPALLTTTGAWPTVDCDGLARPDALRIDS